MLAGFAVGPNVLGAECFFPEMALLIPDFGELLV